MKAYTLVEPYKLEVKEMAVPEIGEREVLIKVSNIGICGSDIHLFKGTYNGPNAYPILFGHEWSGVVEKTGKSVTKVSAGDKVTGDCSKYCGECPNCKEDRNLCKTIEKFGITADGASAEYIVRDERYVYKAAADSDMKLLALTEPIAVAKHLLEKIRKQTGNFGEKKILVYGGGAIGQAALLLMKKFYGCKDVSLSDLVPYRTELAKEFGAEIPPQEELKWTGGSGYFEMYNLTKYDVIIETTGVAPVFVNALNLVKPGGVIGCVGMIANVEIPQKLIVTKSLSIIGSIGGTGEFEDVIDFVNKNREDAARLISHTFSAEKISEAFGAAGDAASAMKISIQL